ncbi:MAG: aminodeoxychorismate synthase component I [Verrucomicrobiota bacterium]
MNRSSSSQFQPLFAQLDWPDVTPVDVFSRIADEPGAIFLDSSGLGQLGDEISIIAFEPEQVIRGTVEETGALESWLNTNAIPSAPDVGFPLGGAFGTISYSGEFEFGLYHRLLVFRHRTSEWFDVGGIASRIPNTSFSKTFTRVDFEPEMGAAEFCALVRRAKEYIAAGDIYQVNLTRRFMAQCPATFDPFPFYEALRNASPAPFSAYLNLCNRQILSSSPEQFLKLSGRGIQTRPIKGTRPRYRDPERDERSRYDLITSEKERAELIMITDLQRNDLGQVCEFGSVQASRLLELETYEQVFHLVSTVQGRLRGEINHVNALKACFPGGSITGAPKKRAREIIAELEPIERGVYTGTIGYFGLNGESQFNIVIRSAVREQETLHFHVGAGIVADSVPELEFEETGHKAEGFFQAASS